MVTISHSNSDPGEDPVTLDVTNMTGPVTPAPGSYVTSVTVSSMCLCCRGQQARRCSVNIGESELRNKMGSELRISPGLRTSGVMNVWMRLRSWLALCAYWGSGISEATSGCDNGQYERNDQMWTRVTEDLIDHCSMRLILTKDMYCTLCVLGIEISDNFQEVFNPSKDHKNLFRG